MNKQDMKCRKCKSSNFVKAGKVQDNQRYKCKECGCQFQPNKSHGRPVKVKGFAVLLHMLGLPMRAVAKIVRVDVRAVFNWWVAFLEGDYYEEHEQQAYKVVVELDEMWQFLTSQKTNTGYGRLVAVIPVNLSTGSVEGEIMLHLQDFMQD